jgi:hypothetical protein
MDAHATLNTTVLIALVVVALLVIVYWVLYTRRLKTPPNTGKEAGIAIPTEKKERAGKTGSV